MVTLLSLLTPMSCDLKARVTKESCSFHGLGPPTKDLLCRPISIKRCLSFGLNSKSAFTYLNAKIIAFSLKILDSILNLAISRKGPQVYVAVFSILILIFINKMRFHKLHYHLRKCAHFRLNSNVLFLSLLLCIQVN